MKNRVQVDRRIRKSKRAIRQALIKLLSQKNLNEITITEIAESADINRRTFYNYYDTPDQVIEEIENDIVCSFDEILLDIDLKENLKHPMKIFETLTNIIQEDFEFYSDLMQAQKVAGTNLIRKISETLKYQLKANLPVETFKDKFTMELSINYVTAGMLEVYKEWLLNPKKISFEKLSKELSTIIFSGLNSVVTERI